MKIIFLRRSFLSACLVLLPAILTTAYAQQGESCFNLFDDLTDPTFSCADASYFVDGADGGTDLLFFGDADTGLLGADFDGFDIFDPEDPELAPPDNLLDPFFSDIQFNQTTIGGQIDSFEARHRGSVSMRTRDSRFQSAAYGSKSRITFIPFTTDGSTDPVILDLDFSFEFTLRDPSDNATRGAAQSSAVVQVIGDDPLEPLFKLDGFAQLDLEFDDDPEFFGDFDGPASDFEPSGPGIDDEFDIDIEFETTFPATPGQPLTLDIDTFGSIFTDGFESGDTSAWSSASVDTLVLTVRSSNPNVRFMIVVEPEPSRGLYFDRARDGHGFDLQRAGDIWFFLMFTYRDDDTPLWYLAIGAVENGVFSGTATQFDYDPNRVPRQQEIAATGGPVSIDFNLAAIDASSACTDGTDRSSAPSLGAFVFDLDGQAGEWCVEPFVFGIGTPATDFTGSWFNSSDDGWGLTIYTQGSGASLTLVVVLYYYDADGQPRWALGVVQSPDFSNEINVEMSQFSGFCPTCTPVAPVATPAGTVNLNLVQPSSDLAAGNTAEVSVTFLGAPGGGWVRAQLPIQLLSDLPD